MSIIQEFEVEDKRLKQEVINCKKCELHKNRKNPVIGEGKLHSKLMIIGEAPGKNEDIKGRPFVGRAGKLLDELTHSIGLEREDVYITNIIKCHPPKNRNPLKKEIVACKSYLDRQIAIIQPAVIATLGNFSSSHILEKYNIESKTISIIHGKIFHIKSNSSDISIVPLYHPAAAIYNPNLKDVLLKDFKSVSLALLQNSNK